MKAKSDRRDFLRLGATVGTGLVCVAPGLAQAQGAAQETSNIWEVFKARRSVRKFKSTPIPEEHLTQILDAAHLAPSPGNAQRWKFLVIRDHDKINQMKEALIAGRDSRRAYYEDYCSAPVYIVMLVEPADIRPGGNVLPPRPLYDYTEGALGAGYLMLAARALGYGTVFATDSLRESVIRRVFNIPDHYIWICTTPLGVPYTWPKMPAKKGLSEVVAYGSLAAGAASSSKPAKGGCGGGCGGGKAKIKQGSGGCGSGGCGAKPKKKASSGCGGAAKPEKKKNAGGGCGGGDAKKKGGGSGCGM